MAKVNVYFSDELEAEARDAGVKLSPVCQAAVRAEIELIARVSAAKDDIAVVARRLLQTKSDADRQQHSEGYALGTRWARERATYADLDRLSNYFEHAWTRIDITTLDTLQGFLVSWALDRDADVDFDWFEYLDADAPFDQGFMAGAKDVYDAVRVYLDSAEP